MGSASGSMLTLTSDPRPGSDEISMSEFDQKAAGWDLDPEKAARARTVAEAIAAAVPMTAETTALDYGCGTGLLGLVLQPRLAHLTLADSSEGMLDVLRQKIASNGLHNVRPMRLDLVIDPLPEERFDLVMSLLTLHHVSDTQALLRSFHALLRAPGTLCVADLDREDGSFHGPGQDVHHGFERAVIATEMQQAGFLHVSVSTVVTIRKPGQPGRSYPVFMAVGRKLENSKTGG
jgi:2-polyprenyl-3-methyl-5-hydroxy-6-metoxy-1,4-benzoquinol methylase